MYLKRVRRLIAALAASGFLNIILLTSIFYSMVKERSPALYCEQRPTLRSKKQTPITATETGNYTILRLQTLSYENLIPHLNSVIPVENGYCERDLALSCLVEFHYFDLDRALLGSANRVQKRMITYGRRSDGSPAMITIYPALSEASFNSIVTFANNEKWPQTAKGLFHILKQNKESYESSLSDAFYLTPTFAVIELLFRRLETPIEKKEILTMLLEGDWQMLFNFAKQQRLYGDISDARRQRILLEYIAKNSTSAASLLLKIDAPFATKKLDDQQVLSILALLSEKTNESEKFALDLLTSPRSDAVWKMAATRLDSYAGEEIPGNLQYQSALQRFIPTAADSKPKGLEKTPSIAMTEKNKIIFQKPPERPLTTMKAMPKKAQQPDRLYIVQEGDTLWKVSRKFNIDVAYLRRYNKLTSDTLKPNSAIRVPATN
jgi:hypothetical protein